MAMQFSVLQPGNLKKVVVPDPMNRVKTLADARAMMQQEQNRGVQLEREKKGLADEEAVRRKAAAVEGILSKGFAAGLSLDSMLGEIKAVDPKFGLAMETSLAAEKRQK